MEKRIVIGVFIILTLAIIVAEYLNFTDFCYSEGRYLGDQGLIDAVVRYEIENPHQSYISHGGRRYASIEDFYEANPICCQLEKWGDPWIRTWDRRFSIWIRKILGVPIFVVKLWYRVRDEGPTPFGSAHY